MKSVESKASQKWPWLPDHRATFLWDLQTTATATKRRRKILHVPCCYVVLPGRIKLTMKTINNHHRNWFKLYFSCVVPSGPTWYYSRVACFVFCFHQVPTCLERSSKKYWLSKKNWKQVARSILRVHETAHIQQMMKHQNGKFSTRVKRMYEVKVENMAVVVQVTCRKCRKLCLCCCC